MGVIDDPGREPISSSSSIISPGLSGISNVSTSMSPNGFWGGPLAGPLAGPLTGPYIDRLGRIARSTFWAWFIRPCKSVLCVVLLLFPKFVSLPNVKRPGRRAADRSETGRCPGPGPGTGCGDPRTIDWPLWTPECLVGEKCAIANSSWNGSLVGEVGSISVGAS
jgi:hypothetical protein